VDKHGNLTYLTLRDFLPREFLKLLEDFHSYVYKIDVNGREVKLKEYGTAPLRHTDPRKAFSPPPFDYNERKFTKRAKGIVTRYNPAEAPVAQVEDTPDGKTTAKGERGKIEKLVSMSTPFEKAKKVLKNAMDTFKRKLFLTKFKNHCEVDSDSSIHLLETVMYIYILFPVYFVYRSLRGITIPPPHILG
jgi:hypothetical protein